MRGYLLLSGPRYETPGGWEDLHGAYSDCDRAKAEAERLCDDWGPGDGWAEIIEVTKTGLCYLWWYGRVNPKDKLCWYNMSGEITVVKD